MIPGIVAPLPMDWRRPTAQDIQEGKWKIKPITAGGHKGIIRVRVKDLNPGEQYTLRVSVTNGAGEESMIDTPPLVTELEPIQRRYLRGQKEATQLEYDLEM